MDVRYDRLGRWIPFAVIGLLGLFGLASEPGLRAGDRPLLFVGLLALHVGLTAWLIFGTPSRLWLGPYFVAQGLLVLGLGVLTPYVSLPLGLLVVLVGEAIWLQLSRWASGALSVGYLALFTVIFRVHQSWHNLPTALLAVAALMLLTAGVVSLYHRQIEARDQAQRLLAELERANAELADYAERVEDLTLAAERQRIARELHDTVAQELTGLILQLDGADSYLTGDQPEPAQARVAQALTQARAALAASRRAIDDLRAGDESDRDLGETIREELQRFAATAAISYSLDLQPLPELPPVVFDHTRRAIAEALANVARHSQASHVWVCARSDPRTVSIEVRDDGVGFDPAKTNGQPGHYGLVGLRERAGLIGGRLDIESAPSRGTTVRLQVPRSSAGVS